MKLNWNFQRGGEGGVSEKKTFRGGGMDIFWNYKLDYSLEELYTIITPNS